MPIISSDVLCCRNWQVGYLYHLVNKCFFGSECMSVNAFVNSHLHVCTKEAWWQNTLLPINLHVTLSTEFSPGGVDGWWGAYTAKGKHEDPEQNEKRSLALHHLLHGQSFANPPLHHPVFSVQGPARQNTLSENPCWEPRLCHHAAHCGVDKEKSGCGSSEHIFPVKIQIGSVKVWADSLGMRTPHSVKRKKKKGWDRQPI